MVKLFSGADCLNLRLQSLPTFGSGQKHLCCWSQIAFPGQSLSLLHETTWIHLVKGSGSGAVPLGQEQLNEPGEFVQIAPSPHISPSAHSSMSAIRNVGHRVIDELMRFFCQNYLIKAASTFALMKWIASVSRFAKAAKCPWCIGAYSIFTA